MSALLYRSEFAAADHLFRVNEDEFQMRLERFDMCGVFFFPLQCLQALMYVRKGL